VYLIENSTASYKEELQLAIKAAIALNENFISTINFSSCHDFSR
jgi:hypothetical protein